MTIDERLSCDVLVIGAGVAGYCAAIQAGREGCDVILLEKDEVLGGNSGPNLGVHISGAHRYHAYAAETGIIAELQERAAWARAYNHFLGLCHYNIHRRWEAVVQSALEDAGVRVLKRHFAKDPVMEGNRVAGVVVEDLAAFRTKQIDVGACVIEASGDGEVTARAGGDFRMGREAQAEHGERSAPEAADDLTQGTSLVALAHRTARPVHFEPPPGTPEFEPRLWQSNPDTAVRHHDGWFSEQKDLFLVYWTETGGHLDTVRDDGDIYERLLRQLWAEWDHVKNGPHAEEARNWDLVWVSPKAGKRESRRFLGDAILTQHDVENSTEFEDAVSYGGFDVDMHEVLGTSADIVSYSVPPLYDIPYRALYSRNLDNVLLAGRLVSVTHIAHATVRVMRTGGAIGQAVGLAAALCHRHACTPREIYTHRLDELRRELQRRDQTILRVPLDDPQNLAARARVTATSEETFGAAEPDDWLPLDRLRGMILYDWPAAGPLRTVSLHLRNRADQPRRLQLSLSRYAREAAWRTMADFRKGLLGDAALDRFTLVDRREIDVPPDHEGWLPVELDPPLELTPKDPLSDEDRLVIWASAADDVDWALSSAPCEIAHRCEAARDADRWQVCRDQHLMLLDPAPLVGEAVRIVNGFERRFSTAPTNMWISKWGKPLPQSITLAFDEPQTIAEAHIIFDTLTEDYMQMPWNAGQRASDRCVRAYELAARVGDDWRPLAQVEGNYHRLRQHTFAPVTTDRLRLTVRGVHDPERFTARVYAIRAYGA